MRRSGSVLNERGRVMKSLALQQTAYLKDEWARLRRFVLHARTQTVRDHARKTMLAIEKELAARTCASKPV